MSNLLNQLIGAASAATAIMGSSLAEDVVKITDADGRQLFATARIMRATIRREATFMEHALENGSSVTDAVVRKPVAIQLAIIISEAAYGSAYAALSEAYLNATPLIVQTKVAAYASQYIQAMPHEETPEAGDSVAMALSLREVVWFNADIQSLPATEVAPSAKTGKKQDASSKKQGQKNGSEASSKTNASIAAGIFL